MKNRLSQVNQVIKKELSQIILKELECPPEVLVTVTRVDASPNLQQVKVYVSCMPEEKGKDILLQLNNQIFELQQKLNQRLNMRPVPKIQFLEEKETAQAGKIEEILEKIRKKKG